MPLLEVYMYTHTHVETFLEVFLQSIEHILLQKKSSELRGTPHPWLMILDLLL